MNLSVPVYILLCNSFSCACVVSKLSWAHINTILLMDTRLATHSLGP